MDPNNIDISKLPADVRKQFLTIKSIACREKDTEQSKE